MEDDVRSTEQIGQDLKDAVPVEEVKSALPNRHEAMEMLKQNNKGILVAAGVVFGGIFLKMLNRNVSSTVRREMRRRYPYS